MTKEEILEFYHKQYEVKVKIVSKNAKKKRVLYALLCVLVLTLVYEYKTQIIRLFTSEKEIQSLDNHISIKNNPEIITSASIRTLKEPFSEIAKENPLYASEGSNLLNKLDNLIMLLDSNKNEVSKDEVKKQLNAIYLFVSKPNIKQNKKLIKFKELILNIAKRNNLKIENQFNIAPLVFNKNSQTVKLGMRNLFKYGEENE